MHLALSVARGPVRPRAKSVTASAGQSATERSPPLREGATVRVTSPITVWHVPKFRKGMNVQGLQGKIMQNVSVFRGVPLSPSKPWKVAIDAKDPAGQAFKFVMHLGDEEMEVLN
uniref:Plastid ferredoxin-thioredoxin reductase variable chain subunit A n=1 Tax=Helicosporidium sp. subsp. Simulium jonesii TaxID=145475 RepID=Q5YBD3_HELSJ|nr:plastid ferredoxin-thioredoxin reductase variable chain subunit A [Helicosporidium sp. ex Simulium jonesi]